MEDHLNRRDFLKKSVATTAAAATAAGLSIEPGKAQAKPTPAPAGAQMPMAKIGDLNVSRLISGGNLISGWAHARDLKYVHHLMKQYNTDEKVMDTLEILEEQGVNTIIADPSERPYRIFTKYWNQ